MIHCGEPQVGELEREFVGLVLSSGMLTNGLWCGRFATEIERLVPGRCLPVSSGTAALHLALLGCGVGPGDEVIVPELTYIATANAVLMCGAKPVFADVDRTTWTLHPGIVAAKITRRTKAIVPVHLYGVLAGSVREVVEEQYRRTGRRIAVIEDCAEALGAPVAEDCDAAAFSFYASKAVTTGGEGGAVVARDRMVAARVEHLAHQGMTADRYVHDCLAWNYRMTELQAAFGVAQLRRLREFQSHRGRVFDWYDARLGDRFTRQQAPAGVQHGHWAYAVLLPYQCRPAAVSARLFEAGVETRPVFPILSGQPHLRLYAAGHGHEAAMIAATGLVLPTQCGLTEENVDTVCKELIRATETA